MVSIRVPVLNEAALGALVALLERTVSLTAEFLDINAYDQPGVESWKDRGENTAVHYEANRAGGSVTLLHCA